MERHEQLVAASEPDTSTPAAYDCFVLTVRALEQVGQCGWATSDDFADMMVTW